MQNALIDPQTAVNEIIGWTNTVPYKPIMQVIPNSARVAEVLGTTFEVAPPLFWTACADDVVQDQFYYDTSNQTIYPIPPAPPYPTPPADQPNVAGAQTL